MCLQTHTCILFFQVEARKKPEKAERMRREKKNLPPLTLEQIAFLEKRKRLRREQQAKEDLESHVPIDLFGSEPLGLFADVQWKAIDENKLVKWRECEQRELRICSKPRPKNLWEEMGEWTEKGMLWQFPINNEQGIDMEKVTILSRIHMQ